MTFFLGDANVHNLPPAVLAQDATEAAAQLRNSFGRLSSEIVQVVVTAILNALGLSFLIPVISNTNNQIQTIKNQEGAILGGIQGALGGLISSALDNLDGTASPIGSQISLNLDGTATIASQLGSTAVNTMVDWADGTAMSVASGLQNIQNFFGTHTYALNNWNTTLQSTGLASAGQLVNSIRGLLPSALDNFDGTAVQTGVSNIVQNLDGTATLAAQVGSSAISQLIDNLDGTVMSLAHSWQNAVGSAQQAGGVNNISAAVAALQRTAIGTGSEFTSNPVNATILFNQYANSPTLPAAFASTLIGSGGAIGITNGTAAWTGTNSGSSTIYATYQTTTATDYQTVSTVFSALNNLGSASVINLLTARSNANGQTCVQATFTSGTVALQVLVNGVVVGNLGSGTSHTPVVGDTYTLVAGTTAGLYNFEVLHNGTVLTTGNDTSRLSQVGLGFRNAGFSMQSTNNTTGVPASLSSWSFGDDTAVYPVGSVFRAYRTSTTATAGMTPSPSTVVTGGATYSLSQIPNSGYDSVQWNTGDLTWNSSTNTISIGIPGTYKVTVSAQVVATASSFVGAAIWHNGTVAQLGDMTESIPSGGVPVIQSSFTVYCAAGDTLQPGFFFISGSAFNYQGDTAGIVTYFDVSLANCGTLS